MNHPQFPAIGTTHRGSPPIGCIAQYWEIPIRDRMVAVIKEIAKEYDNDPKFEGIMLGETSFGLPEAYTGMQFSTIEKLALMDLHTRISSSFQRSHVIQNMNHLDGGDGELPKCDQLNELAEHLSSLGHAMGNPDSVPWESLPWDCNNDNDFASYDYPGLLPGDKPKPNFVVFREKTARIPLFSGNDTSQLECPTNPRTFNTEEMDYDGLVKYHYQTGVSGYQYRPNANTNVTVPPLGSHYLFWADGFINRTTTAAGCPTPDGTHKDLFTDAYLELLSQPGHETNESCPSSINCEGSTSNTPTPTATPGPSLTPSATPTPTLTNTPGPSPTPNVTPLPTSTNTPGPTATPTTLISGNVCGKSDVNGDGVFTLVDFAEFGLKYGNGQNTCSDNQIDYGACGGRDVDRDGFLKLYDFGGENIGFSQRYFPKSSCVLY